MAPSASNNAALLLMKQLKGARAAGTDCLSMSPDFFRRLHAHFLRRVCVCAPVFACLSRCLFIFAELKRSPVEGFSAGLRDDTDPFIWEVMIMGPSDTPYAGGMFEAELKFPHDYPNLPPTLHFTTEFWHPNVFEDGKVCISILHAPGEDQYGYENASERWLPIHTVESILISVISMISSPNDESPANIDAAKQLRDDPEAFRKKVARIVRRSIEG